MDLNKPVMVFCILLLAGVLPRAQDSPDSVFFVQEESLVLFEVDEYKVQQIPDSVMSSLQSFLKSSEHARIRLEGRTDSTGTSEYNLKLAERRVRSVEAYLKNRDFSNNQFSAAVYGQSSPLATNRTPSGRQRNRSVRIQYGHELPVDSVRGRIISDSTGRGISTMVFVKSRYHFDTIQTAEDGRFTARVPARKIISLEAYGGGHVLSRKYINLKRRDTLGTIRALPVLSGKVFHFDDILFVGNKDVVLKESRPLLPRLSLLIKGSPEYRFEIQGHVNVPNRPPREQGSWEYRLSQMRADRIYEYLVETGIDSNRLEKKGYSNWRMLYPKTNDPEEMQKNRRVSIKVLGQYHENRKED